MFQAAFMAHSAEFMADVPNYTNIQPSIQISEVVIATERAFRPLVKRFAMLPCAGGTSGGTPRVMEGEI